MISGSDGHIYESEKTNMFHFWHIHYYVIKKHDQCCKTKLMTYKLQWQSQNAEKVTHIKGKLLDQAVILFICLPFQNGNFS